MKNNIFLMLITLIFIISGMGSIYAAQNSPAKSSIEAEVKAELCCCADNADCKAKCTCTDCSKDGKCEKDCECCCKDKESKCAADAKCNKDGKGCDVVKKAECSKEKAQKGCGPIKGCGK